MILNSISTQVTKVMTSDILISGILAYYAYVRPFLHIVLVFLLLHTCHSRQGRKIQL